MLSAIFKYLVPVKIVLSAAQLFGQGPFDIVGVEKRVSDLEEQALEVGRKIADLEKRINALGGNTEVAVKCNCGKTGKCVCPDDAPCPYCGCPDCPCKEPATENAFSGEGNEVVVFGATWCKYCPPAKRAAEACGVPYVDVDESYLDEKHNVKELPQIVRFQDGEVQERFVGSSVNYAAHIRDFQGKTNAVVSRPQSTNQFVNHNDGDASDDQIRQHLVDAHGYSWGQVSGMNRSQLKAAHNRGHGGPTLVSKNYPVRRATMPTVRYQTYQPRVYFPVSGSCRNCR